VVLWHVRVCLQVSRVVSQSVQHLGLAKFVHKQAGTLSGGNKRKLSVAIALIAEPPIIFLGEWQSCLPKSPTSHPLRSPSPLVVGRGTAAHHAD
jgi:ABC-type branched-subunit amino acid transport system ATPase component